MDEVIEKMRAYFRLPSAEVLALPAQIDVFDERALNRALCSMSLFPPCAKAAATEAHSELAI